MGFGFGGEWTAGAVLIGEVIRPRDRGKAVGMVQAGWAIGWGGSALLYMLVFSLLPATRVARAVRARCLARAVRDLHPPLRGGTRSAPATAAA